MERRAVITLYDQATVDQVPWPATADGDYARRVLDPLLRHGPRRYINNVAATMQVLIADEHVLPLVLSRRHTPIINSYVCSPTTHYLDYAKREVELELREQRVLRHTAPMLLEALRPLLRWSRFEDVVYVNNWLLSTNLYAPLDRELVRTIRDTLAQRFPQRPIIFRSVNAQLNGALLHTLQQLGFRTIFSRQVYLLDPHAPGYQRKKSYQKDMALARRTPYSWIAPPQLDPAAGPRLRDLYAALYLHKYSFFNPQFNRRFMETALRDGWLTMYALQQHSRIDAVCGYVERHGVMTAPLIGYDRSVDSQAGLYRLISLKLVEEARERDLILHLSSGAAAFKRHRGGEPALEYNLVYDRHCAPRRRVPWAILELLTRHAIVPVMQRYEL